VVLFSVIARVEAAPRPSGRAWLVLPLALAALMPVAFLWPPPHPEVVFLSGLVVFAFLLMSMPDLSARPPRIGRAVGWWLSAICIVDSYYLFMLDHPLFGFAASVCFLATGIGQRYVKGT
jgi:hypothetical protein